jgi:peptidoglycan hydrolase-like protein with peptidoglycan-binding domain
MDDLRSRRLLAPENRTARSRPDGVMQRPDRLALWAVVLALVAMAAGAASAKAGSGGLSSSPSGGASSGGSGGAADAAPAPGCANTQFGRRTLKVGDCGDDVETLNWLLASKSYSPGALVDDFKNTTAAAVRAFERDAAIKADGVVEDETAAALVAGMASQIATWYGPGFFGNQTACGQTLTKHTVGVAHKTLPCGARVVIRYKGAYLRTRVIDRGPYANNAKWDLTQAAAQQLGFEYTDEIRVAKLAKNAATRGH